MKSIFKIITIVLLSALVLVSCQPEQTEQNPYVKSSDPAFAKTALDAVPYSTQKTDQVEDWVAITEDGPVISVIYKTLIDTIINGTITEYQGQKDTFEGIMGEVMESLSTGAVPEIATEGSLSITLKSGSDSVVLSATTTKDGETEISYKISGADTKKICTVSEIIAKYQENYSKTTETDALLVLDATLEEMFETAQEELSPALSAFYSGEGNAAIQFTASNFALKASLGELSVVSTLDAKFGLSVTIDGELRTVKVSNSNATFALAVNVENSPKAITNKASKLLADANGPKFFFSFDNLAAEMKGEEIMEDFTATVGLLRVAASCNDLSASVVVKDFKAKRATEDTAPVLKATVLAGIKESLTGSSIGLKLNIDETILDMDDEESSYELLSEMKVYVGGKELVSPDEEYSAAEIIFASLLEK